MLLPHVPLSRCSAACMALTSVHWHLNYGDALPYVFEGMSQVPVIRQPDGNAYLNLVSYDRRG